MSILFETYCRERWELPETWHMASWRDLDWKQIPSPTSRLRIVGYVCPKLEDGRVAWGFEEKATKRSLLFTLGEFEAWKLEWEKRTNRCSVCHATDHHPGQEWMGWSEKDGHRYEPCRRCGGTGSAVR